MTAFISLSKRGEHLRQTYISPVCLSKINNRHLFLQGTKKTNKSHSKFPRAKSKITSKVMILLN